MARDPYRAASVYWSEVVEWDEDNGRYGMDRPLEPILSSDQREYTIEELKDYPEDILYLALNEIYARHGYILEMKICKIILWDKYGILLWWREKISVMKCLMNMKKKI